MILKRLLAILGVLLLSTTSIHAATAPAAPQQVAFIGDTLTYEWQQTPQFQAHTNWLPYGAIVLTDGMGYAQETLQAIIASGKKPVIFLNAGEADSELYIEYPHQTAAGIFGNFSSALDQFITTAQDAKLTVIVGTIPYSILGAAVIPEMNEWIFADCAKHGVPVVNYDYALNTMFPNDWALQPPPASSPNAWEIRPLTPAGYTLITDMATVATGTATGSLKLKSGYLNTVVIDNDLGVSTTPIINSNTVYPIGSVLFTPYGQYSDGSTHGFYNANEYGQVGTWTNSNPLALSLGQNGAGTAMQTGTTNVKFITPSGLTLSEWTMYTVDPPPYPF